MKNPLVTLEQINTYIESYSANAPTSEFSILNESQEHKKYRQFKNLVGYYLFKSNAEIAVNEIKSIIEDYNNLENESIKKWILKYRSLFENKLLGFGLEYFDSGNDTDNNLHLTSLDIYVDKTPFLPIIQFWDLQWRLYFAEYHLSTENRTVPDHKGYYYTPPDPNEPSDLDKVKQILCMA